MKRLLCFALIVVGGLISLAGLGVELIHSQSHAPLVEAFVESLSLSHEENLPTWYSSSLLFFSGLLLTGIAHDSFAKRHRHRFHWFLLAMGFFFMSLDESVGIHENLGGLFGTGGVLYFDWIIVAGALLLVLSVLYVPFLWALPQQRRRQFMVAGALYVGGAVLMELPLGWWTEQHGRENLGYALIDWVEETLEIMGVSYFILSLWEHKGGEQGAEGERGTV
jgi:hypothetical protein